MTGRPILAVTVLAVLGAIVAVTAMARVHGPIAYLLLYWAAIISASAVVLPRFVRSILRAARGVHGSVSPDV